MLVPVTVLDHAERVVGGLRAGNFVVLDNKVPQEIKFLSCEDAPISLIVILDASGSMGAKMEEARNAAIELFQASNPRDEFTVMTFGDVPRIAGSADSLDDIHKTVDSLQSSGLTALWDAMYLGITELKHAEYERKAMVVISDGGDNHSRYTLSEIKSVLKEADVQVYAIGMFDRYPRRVEEKSGPLRLDEVTSVTGGRVISVHDRPELRQAVTRISAELRNQYVLAYSPSNRERDGKWHKIKVQLKAVPTQAKFRLHAKQGYYGPAE